MTVQFGRNDAVSRDISGDNGRGTVFQKVILIISALEEAASFRINDIGDVLFPAILQGFAEIGHPAGKVNAAGKNTHSELC